jgi:hypothetical protein
VNELNMLFVGESWLGSCSTSLKEALRRIKGIRIDEVNEDIFFPRGESLPIKVARRVLSPFHVAEFHKAVERKCRTISFDAVIIYKGSHIDREFLSKLKRLVPLCVNVFPDYSPYVYGARLREAMGVYDLVISTKRFHPDLWNTVYGYKNECAFVPHGYNPQLHLVNDIQTEHTSDVVLTATWRKEYEDLMRAVDSRLASHDVSIAINGSGWSTRAQKLPRSWKIAPDQSGFAYVDSIRGGRICVAPLQTRVQSGPPQQGDEDTSRSYELPAAHCFFVHKRTEFIKTQYDEATEVPMYDGADELADLILKYRLQSDRRTAMARAAHRRAVPAYSLDARAEQILTLVRGRLESSKRGAQMAGEGGGNGKRDGQRAVDVSPERWL